MKLVIVMLVFFTNINISYAGLFGPQTYDECILEKIDKMKNEEAVQALKEACTSKFTLNKKETWKDKKIRAEKDKVLKKCGISSEDDYSADSAFLSIAPISKRTLSYANKNSEIISKLEKTKWIYHGKTTYYSFINKNEFPISGLAIGFLKKDYKQSTCSRSREDYDAFAFCATQSFEAQKGVGSMQYGELPCQDSVDKFPGQSTCIIAYRPAIDYFTEGLAKFMDKQGLCDLQ